MYSLSFCFTMHVDVELCRQLNTLKINEDGINKNEITGIIQMNSHKY